MRCEDSGAGGGGSERIKEADYHEYPQVPTKAGAPLCESRVLSIVRKAVTRRFLVVLLNGLVCFLGDCWSCAGEPWSMTAKKSTVCAGSTATVSFQAEQRALGQA